MEAAFQCTTCGGCEYQCPVGIQHLPIIIGLRRGAANTGKWEDEYGTKLFLKLERNGNALGFAHTEREKFIQKNGLPLYDGTQEYCLWLGCMGSYDPQGREIVLALVRVLRHLGITFGVLRKEKCTGDSARRLGNDLLFTELAQANLEEITKSGAKKLLSICPHCVRTIGTDWKEIGADIPIEHHSELLARLRRQVAVEYERPRKRGLSRRLLPGPVSRSLRCAAAGDRPLEQGGGSASLPRARILLRSRRGPGLPGRGKRQARQCRAGPELVATGASVVAAACPFCNTMLSDGLASAAPEGGPKLLDIAQIVAAGIQ